MKYLFPILLVISSLSVFIITNKTLNGYLNSPTSLGIEIQSHPDSLYNFNIASKAPFKFRVLFSLIVDTSYDLLKKNEENSTLFFLVYKFWSGFFFVWATVLFYFLVRLNYSAELSFTGALLFLSMPPMLLAFTVPVHTREDTLAYAIFFLGLILILQKRFWPLLILSILSAFCRETLLLLPLLFFIFSNEKWQKRTIILFIPIACWLLFRLFNQEHYDYLEGFRWNVLNPIQVVGFLFITFNVLWLFFFGSLFKKHTSSGSNVFLSFFYRSFFIVFILIILSTFLGGIFNEIRLLFLLAPWIIILSLEFIKNNRNKLLNYFSLFSFQLYLLMVFLLVFYLQFFMPLPLNKIVVPGKFSVPYDIWFRVSFIYIGLFLIALPPIFSVLFLNDESKA
jgi:hypothetical protein